ncbi:hypothetical protein [Streptomyces justiciae]|uniref:Uncharacterized protein n=1 Tax=Streptomyces justiciae TaxID=2780140 RepID=A0ABU3M6N9_9ACTN|nr:hypothetical protein [Streptomyces justiciae]MDT7847185.1 hypothetical protein [Streptomyces justiciae]
MAQDSWPSPAHNARAVTDLEYERIAQRFSDNGIYGDPLFNDAVVSAGTGLNVNIRAFVRGSVRGHSWYSGTSTVTLAIAANASGSTRIDRVVLRLDRSDWTVRAAIRQGTAGAGAPALVQDNGDTGVYEIPLATVSILNGASSVTVTRTELYVGTRLRPCTSTTRNPSPTVGEQCFEIDTGRVRLYTGSGWITLYDDTGVIGINAPTVAWSNETECVLELRNGSVHLRLGSFTRAAGTLAGDIESRLPAIIPADYRHPTRDQYVPVYISGAQFGRVTVYSKANTEKAGQCWLTNKPTISNGQSVLTAASISWAVD